MKWAEMSKKKRDLLVIQLVAGVGLVAAAVVFGVRPFLAGRQARAEALHQLEGQIAEAERLVKRDAALESERAEIARALTDALHSQLPPEDNPFLWATTRIYDFARRSHLTVESVNEVVFTPPEWIRKAEPKKKARGAADDGEAGPEAPGPEKKSPFYRRFAPFRVQLALQGDFRDLVVFLRLLEDDNPWMAIPTMTVNSDDLKPAVQIIHMELEWPRHVGPLDEVLAKAAGGVREAAR